MQMEPFLPNLEGWPSQPEQNAGIVGSKTRANDGQAYWEYISGVTDYEQYMAAVEKRFVVDGIYDLYHDLLNQVEQVRQCDEDRSYYSGRHAFTENEEERAALLEKLTELTSTHAGYQFNIADRGLGIHEVLKSGNDRTSKLHGVPEFKSYMAELGLDLEVEG